MDAREETVNEVKQISLAINMDISDFGGVFSNGFEMYTNSGESRIDFMYIDLAHTNIDTMEAPAKVVSRVIMTSEKLAELRDLLNRHFDGGTEGDNA